MRLRLKPKTAQTLDEKYLDLLDRYEDLDADEVERLHVLGAAVPGAKPDIDVQMVGSVRRFAEKWQKYNHRKAKKEVADAEAARKAADAEAQRLINDAAVRAAALRGAAEARIARAESEIYNVQTFNLDREVAAGSGFLQRLAANLGIPTGFPHEERTAGH